MQQPDASRPPAGSQILRDMLRNDSGMSTMPKPREGRVKTPPKRSREAGARRGGESGRLSDRAYAEIRRRIIELILRPGSQISEPELSASLRYTKASVRAALVRLAQEKLVRPVARQGYVVSPLTIEDARNILDLRLSRM